MSADTYRVPARCYNCKTRFIAEDDEDANYYYDPPEIMLEIPKGVKLCDMECPVCGCKTLLGGEE